MRSLFHKIIIGFCRLIVASSKVYAVDAASVAAQIPSLFDPGLTQKIINSTTPASQPVSAGPIKQPVSQPATPIPGAENIFLTLTKVNIEGNTVFSTDALQRIFRPSINKKISLADLQNLVEEITTQYRAAGYVLSRAILPAQRIEHGVVKVQVIEGYISQLIVTGTPGANKPLLEKYAQPVLQARPFKINALEQAMLLINDIPGFQARAILTPSATASGGADLTLVAERSFASSYISYDNYGTRYLGPLETSIGGNLYSFFDRGDNTGIQLLVTSQTNEVRYAQLTHTEILGSQGLTWLLGVNYTRTQPQFVLAPLEIIGTSKYAFTDFSYPLIRTRSTNLNLHTGFNYENIYSTILSAPYYDDLLRPLVVGISFNNADRWAGLNTITFDVSHGFNIFGAGPHVLESRPNGQSRYTLADFTASRLQGLGSRFSLLTALSSQYSFEALLASAQYGFGGPNFGRGYDPYEIVGDQGIAGKVELRMDTSPALRLLQNIQYYVFYDIGKIWNIDKVNMPPEQSATSTGAGARVNFMPNLSGNVFIGKPLSHKVSTEALADENPYGPRVFFQLIANF